ncbi:MAG: 50S ribosomal protein L18, partial [Alphaproteobacteria bacterium]|nr:50S ribosomal protein L18 [Alphaproteobacteria bacterium]
MYKPLDTRAARQRRHRRLRVRLQGTEQRPRLSVFRSLQHIYAQIIDDSHGVTLASASTRAGDATGEGPKTEHARAVGRTLAERARARGIQAVVFD